MATKTNTAVKYGEKQYNYYRITRTIGHKWENGKKVPIKKPFLGKSKTEAERKYKEWLEDQIRRKYEKEIIREADQQRPFGEYAKEYTYKVLPDTSYALSTKDNYTSAYNSHVSTSPLMQMPICEISANTILEYYEALAVNKGTLASINNWMNAFYRWISRSKDLDNIMVYITELPAKAESKRHNEIVVWDPDETEKIFTAANGYSLKLLIYLLHYEGLRISECAALMKTDPDLENDTLSISRQNYKGEMVPPKYNSYRTLPLHPKVKEAYLEHIEWQKKETVKRGYRTNYLFTSKHGKVFTANDIRKRLSLFYQRNGIPEKHPHAYRATFCTNLCRAEVPLEVASKLMGHKSIAVTARHYALVNKDTMKDAINRL